MKTMKIGILVFALMLAGMLPSDAQNFTASRRATVYIPGLMTGPGSFGPIGFRRLCDLRVTGLVEWRVTWIERAIKPNDAQKAALGHLQTASTQARTTIAAVCSRARPVTSVAELEMMDKRLDALTQAFKTVKPAYETFYASLDPGQKARIDGLGPHRHGWRW